MQYASNIFCLFLFILFVTPHIVFGISKEIFISEIFYDAEGSDTGKEYIAITNSGASDIDITGWDLDPSTGPYYTLPYFVLQAGKTIVIRNNTEGVDSESELFTGPTSNMSNTKGPVALFSSTKHTTETLVDYVSYGVSGQTNESKAIKKGIWEESLFLPDTPKGTALILSDDTWSIGIPTYHIEEKEDDVERHIDVTPTIPEPINDMPVSIPSIDIPETRVPILTSDTPKPKPLIVRRIPTTTIVLDVPTTTIPTTTPDDIIPTSTSTIRSGLQHNLPQTISPTTLTTDFSSLHTMPHMSHVTITGYVLVPPDLFAQTYMYIISETTDEDNVLRGIKVTLPRNFDESIEPHSIVTISGMYKNTSEEPYILLSSITQHGFVDRPIPTNISSEFITDDLLGSYVSLSGTVVSKKGNSIYVDDEVEEFRVYLYPQTKLKTSGLIEGDTYTISGVLSKTRSGFRLLPVSEHDVRHIIVASENTERAVLIPQKTTHERSHFVYFLVITAGALGTIAVFLSMRIRKRKREIATLES